MSNLRQAAELALEIIETHHGEFDYANEITALRAALAQPEQEPMALVIDGVLVKSALPEKYTGHLYTAPPQRLWVGLTAEEAAECWTTSATQTWKNFEAKLKANNT
ncbi:hypothetical protein UFOVP376_27 [uncultured Caudovirales phage]|uniref:Uncharacterized protein n=1 Tax=uncultured Caudovirales phage TaxID=2100421 RepID=A0A6J7WXS1_9CAUD|nr:hypothetical protein UFOVP376_27 [uncultured Caudovirales phage]